MQTRPTPFLPEAPHRKHPAIGTRKHAMPMTADQLEARDATRDIGAELLQSHAMPSQARLDECIMSQPR